MKITAVKIAYYEPTNSDVCKTPNLRIRVHPMASILSTLQRCFPRTKQSTRT